MSSVLYNIPDSQITIKYRQPYVSEALNRKSSITARGIVRGLYPASSVNNNELVLKVDGHTLDTVVNCAGRASSGTEGNFFLTWRTTDNVSIIIPNDSALHFIYIQAGYTFGQATAPKIVDYTEAEFEAGTPEQNGGVLVCVIKARATAGIIEFDNIYLTGLSNTARIPFFRDWNDINRGEGWRLDSGSPLEPIYHCEFAPTNEQGKVKRTLSSVDYALGYR